MTRRRGYPGLVWLLAAGMLCCTTQSGPGDRSSPGGDRGDYIKPEWGTGQLAVTVTITPMSPVERAGEKKPASHATGIGIRVLRADGTVAGTGRTDARGECRFLLAAGSYRVELETPPAGMMFTKDLPAQVTVAGGQETRLDVRMDTGIR